MLLEALHAARHKPGRTVVAVGPQIDRAPAAGVCGQSVDGVVDRHRVEERQQIGHTALPGQAEETALPGLLCPVVRPVGAEEAVRSCVLLDLCAFALLRTAGAQVEAPERQTYTAGLPGSVVLRAEQPVGYLALLCLGP